MRMSQGMNFPSPWINSSICWISRRSLEQEFPMISSISLRLLQKTCGLFDTGLAGDAELITSFGPTAPAHVLTEFDLGGHNSSINFTNPAEFGTNGDELGSLGKDSQVQSLATPDVDNWDLLDDLSADPLGDESLDAFINLDKYLTGNSFFDEDGNFVQEPEEVKPVINIPTVEDTNQYSLELVQNPIQLLQNPVEMVQSSPLVEVTQSSELSEVATEEMPKRKRKRKAISDGVKTSLFEIPESASTSSKSVADNQLDHDYTAKPKRRKVTAKPGSSVHLSDSVDNYSQASTSSVTILESSDNTLNDSTMPSAASVDKQTMRRLKNNVASKRSREQRKQKFIEMDLEAEELVEKNEALRKKIIELEKLAAEMKSVLVAKMAGK